jgi:hypothetical protein
MNKKPQNELSASYDWTRLYQLQKNSSKKEEYTSQIKQLLKSNILSKKVNGNFYLKAGEEICNLTTSLDVLSFTKQEYANHASAGCGHDHVLICDYKNHPIRNPNI